MNTKMHVNLILWTFLLSVTQGCTNQSADVWTDSSTRLMWMVQAADNNGQGYNWKQAKNYCANLNLAGYSDWRLPTIDELRGLIRGCPYTEIGGSCDVGKNCLNHNSCVGNACKGCKELKGPGTNGMYQVNSLIGNGMWSSSTDRADSGLAWAVDFRTGQIGFWNKTESFGPLRCVRGTNKDDNYNNSDYGSGESDSGHESCWPYCCTPGERKCMDGNGKIGNKCTTPICSTMICGSDKSWHTDYCYAPKPYCSYGECEAIGGGGSGDACSNCLESCRGLPGCCTGCGCMCEEECNGCW